MCCAFGKRCETHTSLAISFHNFLGSRQYKQIGKQRGNFNNIGNTKNHRFNIMHVSVINMNLICNTDINMLFFSGSFSSAARGLAVYRLF